jgi:hypothetical protein
VAGKAQRGTCESKNPNDQWDQRRVVFNLNDAGGTPFAQPSVFTHLFEGVPDGGGPQKAIVTLHSIASVRSLPTPAPQIIDLFTPDLPPPTANPSTVLPPLVDTVQRGGLPQYRVTFQDGSPAGAKLYCDGNCVLALPARKVSVDIMTPTLLGEQTRDPSQDVPAGLIVEAIAMASVAWAVDDGSSAPMGPVNYTQATHTVEPVEPIFFERPPFARRVTVIPPPTVGSLIVFVTSPTVVTATPPPIANTRQRSQPVPAFATHVRVTFPAATPASLITTCIWEIGV